LQAVNEPFALFAEQIFRRHVAIAENHFAGVARAQAQLVFFFAGLESVGSLLDDERGNPVAFFRGVRHRHADANVGVVPVGGESFRTVDDPAAVFLHGRSAGTTCIGAGLRFGERPAAEFLALCQRRDVFFLLLVAAKFIDVIRAQRIVCRDDDADRTIHAREFFDDDGVFGVAHARAAVFFRKNHAQESHLRQLGN